MGARESNETKLPLLNRVIPYPRERDFTYLRMRQTLPHLRQHRRMNPKCSSRNDIHDVVSNLSLLIYGHQNLA